MSKKLINKKTVGGAILVLLVLLIFASRTIYAYSLPSVTATKPSRGKLTKEEKSTGLVDYARTENVYSDVNGKVEDVLVREGDTVTEGQPLLRLSFDRTDVENKLKDLEVSRTRLDMDRQNIQTKIDQTNRSVSELKAEVYTADEVSYSALDKQDADIAKAEADLEDKIFLFDLGEVSSNELQKARSDLDALYTQRNEQKKSLDDQAAKNAKTVADQEKTRQTRLRDYEDTLKSYDQQLKSNDLDQSNLGRQEQGYLDTLASYDDNTEIKASVAGVVTALKIERGQSVNANMQIASIGVNERYVISCAISLDNNFVLPGDTCTLSNATHTVRGTVTNIEPDAKGKNLNIDVLSDEVTAGETFDISFKQDSGVNYVLVPNGALNQDSDGYYLNQIRKRDGLLGQEYYLVRQDVYIGDSDASNTVILQGVTFFEPIVQISDKSVSPGDVVSVSNVGSFFEN